MLFDQRVFFLYAFLLFAWLSHDRFHRIRRLVRVYQVSNDVKLLAIARKLGVSAEEIEAMFNEAKAEYPSTKAWKSLEAQIERAFHV